MARRTKIKNPREARSQRLRRSQNAALNASAWSRLRRREIIASEEPDKIENSETMQIPYDPNDKSQRQHEDSESEDEEEDTTSRWLTFAEEEEQEEGIGPSIHSIQEEYRRRAREFNWSCLMKQLHTWYLTLKLHTKNWSGTNAYEEYKSDACKCTAQQKTTRPIDMVDIYVTAEQNQCRERLTDPDLDLLSDAEVKKISDKIEKVSKKLNKDAAEAEALAMSNGCSCCYGIRKMNYTPKLSNSEQNANPYWMRKNLGLVWGLSSKKKSSKQWGIAAQHEYRTSMLRNWDNMRTKMGLPEYASSSNLPEVDVELEEAILEVGADDGEDAEEDMFLNTDAEDDGTDDD
ncbi:hypothetical protein PtA15_10A326 [Puccinia triticina]|uniref:CxC1-like cysteine cluster associated with KDZ transposases domain-containing protein n=1 Tax=Puccinia triticina TaxID=208348 RepID=A0ABY7CUC7_9BASI|nr:uncharacterized protein PtA15_10A326 [Puccinia triticina]WAQ88904.1 hypothetical protein PtA15_10A326 [Puccinia triticina]